MDSEWNNHGSEALLQELHQIMPPISEGGGKDDKSAGLQIDLRERLQMHATLLRVIGEAFLGGWFSNNPSLTGRVEGSRGRSSHNLSTQRPQNCHLVRRVYTPNMAWCASRYIHRIGSINSWFIFEETRHATAATVVVESSSFDEKEVLSTQNTANC